MWRANRKDNDLFLHIYPKRSHDNPWLDNYVPEMGQLS